jgi:hypothetical protein
MIEKDKLREGDLVRRIIPSRYTMYRQANAIGVVISYIPPIAKVYFDDSKREEWWNQSVLEIVSKKE